MRQVNNDKLQKATEVMRALAHPLRIEIIKYIDSQGYASVKQVYLHFSMDKTDLTNHLRMLRLAKLILPQKANNKVVYSLNYDKLERITD